MLISDAQLACNERTTLDQCSECAHPLSLRTPAAAAMVSAWLCNQCGAAYFADRPEEVDALLDMGARQVAYELVMQSISTHFLPQSSAIRPRDVERLIQCLSGRGYTGQEKRNQTRYRVAAPITVVPLAGNFRIAGKPVRTVLCNVSCGGAAFMSATRIADRYVLVDFDAAGVNLPPAVLKVGRIQPLQQAFTVAGEFLSRVRTAI